MDTTMEQNQDQDYENIFKSKVEEDISKSCFICSNSITGEIYCVQDEVNVNPVKILTGHLLNSSLSSSRACSGREELQSKILSSFKNGKCSICAECLSRAENLLELHLELEKIQMQILDVLKNLQDHLKSKMVRIDDDGDDLLSRFQDVLQQEFISRQLSSAPQLNLEGLRGAGVGQDIPSSLFYILDEPEVQSSRDGSTGNDNSKRAVASPGSGVEQVISGDLDFFQDALDDPDLEEDVDLEEEEDEKDIKPFLNVTTIISSLHENEIHNHSKSQTQISVDPGSEDDYKRRLRWKRKRASSKSLQEIIASDKDDDIKPLHGQSKGGQEISSDHCGSNVGGTDQEDLAEASQNIKPLNQPPKREKRGSGGKIWDCDICLETIPAKEMKSHLQSHPEFEKFYECDLCPSRRKRLCYKQIYGTYKGLVWHYLRAKLNSQVRAQHRVRLPCILCPEDNRISLFKRAELCKHLYENHHSNQKKLPCKKEGCPEEFYDPITRRSHFYQVHSPTFHGCSLCPKEFKSRAGLRSHVKSKHEDPDLVMCPQCGKKYPRHGLSHHIRQDHKRKEGGHLKCQHCPKTFVFSNDLKSHEETHRTERSFECPVEGCSYAARYEKALKNHQKIHNEKKFQCQFCAKVFGVRGYLKRHELTHKKPEDREEEKVFTCQYCPKTFSLRKALGDHEDAHRNERKFPCPEPGCQYVATNKSGLTVHKLRHKEKIFKCQFCPLMFATKCYLTSHEYTHSTEKRFQCNLCEDAFNTVDARYRHRKKVHADAVVKRNLAGVGIVNQEEKGRSK